MNLRGLLLAVSTLAALNVCASIALAATKVASEAEKATSEAAKPETGATETATTEAKTATVAPEVKDEASKAATEVKPDPAKEAAEAKAEEAKASADVHNAESSAEKAATEVKQAADSTEKAAKESEHAAESISDSFTDWFDSITGKVKSWLSTTPETTQKYSDEIKKQYQTAKKAVQDNVKQGVTKGREATETVTQWFDKTFSQQRIDEAKQWLTDFKKGTEETVIDPLVPYLLAIRYPHPIDEWEAGYRRVFNVQLKGFDKPVDIQLPMSWAITETFDVDGNKIIAWRSDSGDGQLMTAIMHTPNGASVESVMAGLEKARPDAKVVSIGKDGIKRITYFAMDNSHNAYFYYAIPLAGKTLELCTGVIRTGGEGHEELNKRLEERADFFNLVAENIFTRSTPQTTPTE
ncbi:MAG: hypothetical protein LUC43_08285 [Burkholderiales bacterium]|nr:hypothetical protein [Burkholderiales bacterium]